MRVCGYDEVCSFCGQITVLTMLSNFILFYSLFLDSKANIHSSLLNNVIYSALFSLGNNSASKCFLLYSLLATIQRAFHLAHRCNFIDRINCLTGSF